MKRLTFLLTIFVFLITVSPLSALAVVYDAGDIDESCAVDVNDFALLAAAWHTDPNYSAFDPNCDINLPQPDEYIDSLDLLELVEDWLLSDEVKWAEGKEFMLVIEQAILDYIAAHPEQIIPDLTTLTFANLGLTPADLTGEYFSAVDFSIRAGSYSPPDNLLYVIRGSAPVGCNCVCEPDAFELDQDGNWTETTAGP